MKTVPYLDFRTLLSRHVVQWSMASAVLRLRVIERTIAPPLS